MVINQFLQKDMTTICRFVLNFVVAHNMSMQERKLRCFMEFVIIVNNFFILKVL